MFTPGSPVIAAEEAQPSSAVAVWANAAWLAQVEIIPAFEPCLLHAVEPRQHNINRRGVSRAIKIGIPASTHGVVDARLGYPFLYHCV